MDFSKGLRRAIVKGAASTALGQSGFVKFVMSNANTRYRLPAGDTRVNIPPQEPLGTRWIPPERPKLKYLQKDERTCVYKSFASCMHYLGYEKFAKLTHNISGRKSENVNNLKNLRKQ